VGYGRRGPLPPENFLPSPILVVLSFLDSRLYAAPARPGSIEIGPPIFCDLRDLGHRQRGRRVDFLVSAAARPLGECVAKMGDARLRESVFYQLRRLLLVYRDCGPRLSDRLAAAAHQGFSANLYTLTSDLFPTRAVGSVVGMGGMAGAVGGMLIAEVVGHVLQWTNSYMIPFFIAASAYLVALLVIHLLSPKLAPAELEQG